MIYFKSKQQLLYETLYFRFEYSDLFNGVKIVYFSINIFHFTSADKHKQQKIVAKRIFFILSIFQSKKKTPAKGYFKKEKWKKFMDFLPFVIQDSHKHKINLHIEN